MNCIVKVAEERDDVGHKWQVLFDTGREEFGTANTYDLALANVRAALYREKQSREIHAYYDAHAAAHTDSGD